MLVLQAIIFMNLIVSTKQIVRGRLARKCQFPYIAYVYGYSRQQRATCGGTLIDESHVLTAAHCVDDDHRKYYLLFGSTYFGKMSFRIPVKKIAKHGNYTRIPRPYNDVAILKLSRPLKLSKCIQPLKLASADDVLLTNCSIAGWGGSTMNSPISRHLFYAKVPLLTFDHCHQITPKVTNHNVCAGQFVMDTQTTCHGDSGGPLVCTRKSDGLNVLTGIVSYGWDCREGLSIFSKVSFYRDWILKNSRISLTQHYQT